MKRSVILFALFAAGLSWAQSAAPKKVPTGKDFFYYFEEKRDPWQAGIWSMAIPGAGHVYNGNFMRGLLFAAIRVAPILILDDQLTDPETRATAFSIAAVSTIIIDVSFAASHSSKHNRNIRIKYGLSGWEKPRFTLPRENQFEE